MLSCIYQTEWWIIFSGMGMRILNHYTKKKPWHFTKKSKSRCLRTWCTFAAMHIFAHVHLVQINKINYVVKCYHVSIKVLHHLLWHVNENFKSLYPMTSSSIWWVNKGIFRGRDRHCLCWMTSMAIFSQTYFYITSFSHHYWYFMRRHKNIHFFYVQKSYLVLTFANWNFLKLANYFFLQMAKKNIGK